MSERQARLNRKENQKETVNKKKSGNGLFNTIVVLIVLVFLGLGGYAMKDQIKSLLPEQPEKPTTVADIAKDKDMTVDELLAEYGLKDGEITKDSTEAEMTAALTVENYAKYMDLSVDELLEQYGIEGVDKDMLWQDAYMEMPMSKYAEQMGSTFADMKDQAMFPDSITEKTTLKEAQEIMAKIQEEAQKASEQVTKEAEAEETETKTTEETKTAEDAE